MLRHAPISAKSDCCNAKTEAACFVLGKNRPYRDVTARGIFAAALLIHQGDEASGRLQRYPARRRL